MTRWSFEIRLNTAPSDDEIDALFEGGLDDCSIAGDLVTATGRRPACWGPSHPCRPTSERSPACDRWPWRPTIR